MGMQTMTARPCRRLSGVFPAVWFTAYLAGASAGLLAARASAARMGGSLISLCARAGDLLSPLPLFCSASLFFLVTILLSQLPCGGGLLALLTALKAFSTAYVLGAFYLFRLTEALDAALLRYALHTAALLPVFCALACACYTGRSGGRGAQIPPPVFAFAYLAALAALEWIFW